MSQPVQLAADTGTNAAVQVVLTSYVAAYKNRARKRSGAPFDSIEPDSLAALAIVRDARGRGAGKADDLMAALDGYTRVALEKGVQHSAAVDIAGLAWAEAYGVLPLEDPPQEVLEWVLARGAASGAVRGVAAGAWRLLGLLTALPLYNHANRAAALSETRRWLTYVEGKIEPVQQSFELGLRDLRFAYVLAAVADLADRPVISEAARTRISAVLEAQDPDGSLRNPQTGGRVGTAHTAQFALAAYTLGEGAAAQGAVDFLVRERRDPKSGLLHPEDDIVDRGEMAPWVPLALAEIAADPEKELGISPLRRLLRRVRTMLPAVPADDATAQTA